MFKILKVVIQGLGLIIGSWILIHVLAIAGVFVAVAKPFWWLFFPEISICFVCRAKDVGEWCNACHKKVTKDWRIHSFRSVIINSLIILALSIAAIGLVWLETKGLQAAGIVSFRKKTVSFTIPDRLQYRLGEVFPMKLELTGVEEPVNVIQADLNFNPQNLEVAMIDTSGSLANVFIQKEMNNEVGYVRLTGGLPSPGFKGERGLFGTVFFKGKQPGLAKVEYLPTSMVLANDGRGTNVMKNLSAVTYLILAEPISEKESEQQSVLLSQKVLGESTDGVMRLDFSNETQVLGIETELKQSEKILGEQIQSGKTAFWQVIHELDQKILSGWRWLLKLD